MGKNQKINIPKSLFKQIKIAFGFAICTTLLVILTNVQSFAMFINIYLTNSPRYQGDIKLENVETTIVGHLPTLRQVANPEGERVTRNRENSLINISQTPSLPPQNTHPLPSSLSKWQDDKNNGDYFSQIKPSKYGYLVWSQFPVKVYLEAPNITNSNQSQQWINVVSQTVEEWNNYLPLKIVENPEIADITIVRKSPPLQITPGSKFPRARSALTSYNIYTKNNTLYHRFTILLSPMLSPTQGGKYLLAASRHELGHALGIWGHSKDKGDALYFSQVRNPPLVSPRDVNTLKKIYQQPTSLGWKNVDK